MKDPIDEAREALRRLGVQTRELVSDRAWYLYQACVWALEAHDASTRGDTRKEGECVKNVKWCIKMSEEGEHG